MYDFQMEVKNSGRPEKKAWAFSSRLFIGPLNGVCRGSNLWYDLGWITEQQAYRAQALVFGAAVDISWRESMNVQREAWPQRMQNDRK